MTNQEMFLKRLTLLNITLSLEGKELPSELKAKIMLMRVAYDKAAKAFDDDMQQVLKEIKKEGYDERAQRINRMKEVDGKEDATKEEKKEAFQLANLTPKGQELFEQLRKCRTELAAEKGVPPYIICSDKTLTDMCAKCPADNEDMETVYGMGVQKFKVMGNILPKSL